MCGPKEYGFLAILVIDKVLILVILAIERASFLHSSLELCMFFLEEPTFSSFIICW